VREKAQHPSQRPHSCFQNTESSCDNTYKITTSIVFIGSLIDTCGNAHCAIGAIKGPRAKDLVLDMKRPFDLWGPECSHSATADATATEF